MASAKRVVVACILKALSNEKGLVSGAFVHLSTAGHTKTFSGARALCTTAFPLAASASLPSQNHRIACG
jgi:hypothetical protein